MTRPAGDVDWSGGEAPESSGTVQVRPRLSRVRTFLRYTGVNLVTVTLDYAIFLWLTHELGMPTLASVVAYAIALVLNYELSRRFVFGSDGSHKSEQRLRFEFLVTGLLGLALTACMTALGVHVLHLAPAVAKTIAVLVCFVVLYAIRSRLVFTPRVE